MRGESDCFNANVSKLRLLVAIASFGERQLHFLKRVIQNYHEMALNIDVVVLSEAPKVSINFTA